MDNNYIITKNDLKYKKFRNLNTTLIKTLDKNNIEYYDKDLESIFYNDDLDTLDYRLKESQNTNWKMLDYQHLDLFIFPVLNDFLINNLEELFLSNNELQELPDLSHFKKLKVIDY